MEAAKLNIHFIFIELIAFWEGRINASQVRQYFSLSRQQASKYIKSYRANYPHNLVYNANLKGFETSPLFIKQQISADVCEYLNWLDTQNIKSKNNDFKAHTHTALSIPDRQVSPFVMRSLITAMRKGMRADVDYISLTHASKEGRVIQPVIFVKTGLRWHLRAFDEKHQQYRDFVLSRFRGEPELLGKTHQQKVPDHSWETKIDLVFKPDSRLSDNQKTVVEQDYQMQNGRLVINTRAALAQYVLQEMQVNIKQPDKNPTAQQLVLTNKHDIKQWLFDA